MISIHSLKKKLRELTLIKAQDISPLVIILSFLMTFSLDYVLILLGENWCWSLGTMLSYGHTSLKRNILTWCQDQPREVVQALFVLCNPQVCNLEMKPSSPQIQQELGIFLHLCKDIPVNRLWYAFQYDTWQYFLTKE